MKASKMIYTIEYKGRELVRIYKNPSYTWGHSYTLLAEGHGVHHCITPRKLMVVLARAAESGGVVYHW